MNKKIEEDGRQEVSHSSKEKKMNKKIEEKMNIVGADCHDEKCPFHGKLKVRGRIFEGRVVKKLPTRIAIEFERMIYISKYERYYKYKTKIHARLPKCMEENVKLGDLIQIQECRPLSKIIHFVVIKKLKNAGER